MAPPARILVCDDDPHIRQVVTFALRKVGFETIEAQHGVQALKLAAQQEPDLIILDILMPEMDGTEVCRTLRRTSNVPIVFLSSMDDELDRVIGLELGGDDYVTKPFSPRELVARVRAVLRRVATRNESQPDTSAETRLTHGRLCLNLDRFEVQWDTHSIVLTVTEFGVLRTLLGYPGKVFSRDELMNGAYDFATVVTHRTIDSHVRRVRQKFAAVGGEPIDTVHGVGYKLSDCQ